jgi:superfamily II DNA or RNA helicase
VRLRGWQQQFVEALRGFGGSSFLLVACPGAGKTVATGAAVKELIPRFQAEQLIVVCPTTALRAQWADALHGFALPLDPRFRNADGVIRRGFTGVVVTYQQVASQPDLFDHLCGRKRTIVVFDEIHHASEESSWGERMQRAFERARFQLSLSGTPFRSDGNPIPFIRYEGGCSVADFAYEYAEAVRDGVVRPVEFPRHGGTVTWHANGAVFNASFDDPLDEIDDARRLRTALSADNDYMRVVISAADERLTALRESGIPEAAGLLIADDIEHARAIARLFVDIGLIAPVVVASDEDDPHGKIESFSQSHDRWIIAVNMISEGVDIPRLTVLVYATCRRTELFFRQAVGRVVRARATDPERLLASVFIPADQKLTALAKRIEEEIRHELRRGNELADDEDDDLLLLTRRSDFRPLAAEAEEAETIIDGVLYSPAELARARALQQQLSLGDDKLPTLLESFRDATQPADAAPAHRRVDQLRDEMTRLVGSYTERIRATFDGERFDWKQANALVNRAMGVRSRKEAGVEELEGGVAWLRKQISDFDERLPLLAARIERELAEKRARKATSRTSRASAQI